MLFFRTVSEQDSDDTVSKECVVITVLFCVCVYIYGIYMNNAFNGVNTFSMAVFPWKMLLRGLV